ncbi:glycosyltransferase family 9 protein [Stackebrandtia albiflava]|uniref:glycosyltransferase family 9 protein n=1 Tax=Stackebrandtia albiflava TaxID=406432 RepID=UPI0011BE79E6
MAVTRPVLVLRALGVGDLLTAVPALRALRRAAPGRRVLLAAPEGLAELVAMIDAVDELWPTAGLGALRAPAPVPELAVNLHGSGPQSIDDLRATGAPGLLSHRHPERPDVDGPPWRDELHEVDRWCRLVEYTGVTADRGDLGLPPVAPHAEAGAIVVHPGAAYPARRWPASRFHRVVRELHRRGHRVVVTGGPSERGLAAAVARGTGLGAGQVLAGRTGLAELAAVVASARLVICGDTGVGHLATAFGTPSVLLFGPTPPKRWGPPPERTRHRVMWAGDVGDPLGDRPDPGLLLLHPDRVLAVVDEVLASPVPR